MVLGNAAMKLYKVAFALLSLATVSCSDSGTSKAAVGSCTLDLIMSPDGTPMLTGDCTRDAKGIAAAFERAHGILKSAREIALGRTAFGSAGAFDRCAILARLADDPRWTASIDSSKANLPLRDALQADKLALSISDALAKAGRKLRGVSLEKVLLSDGPVNDCPKSPTRTPIEAQIWLGLD
jgi:hypothetical protein